MSYELLKLAEDEACAKAENIFFERTSIAEGTEAERRIFQAGWRCGVSYMFNTEVKKLAEYKKLNKDVQDTLEFLLQSYSLSSEEAEEKS